MPKTAVINPRRRRRSTKRRRRRNPATVYGSAANPRRRRRRRRNPTARQATRSAYASRGYRQKNPPLDFNGAVDILPAATAGSVLSRWALGVAGEMKDDKPGIAHAIAVYIAAVFGSDLIGNILGSGAKGNYAQIGALAMGGDLFLRKYFLEENDWAKENLFLGEGEFDLDDDDDDDDEDLDLTGFTDQSALGETGQAGSEYVDEQGRRWMQTAAGWTLLSGDYYPEADPALQGFTDQSALGYGRAAISSFGYR